MGHRTGFAGRSPPFLGWGRAAVDERRRERRCPDDTSLMDVGHLSFCCGLYMWPPAAMPMDDGGLLDPDTLKPMDHASQAHIAPVEPMERRGVAAVVPACSSGTAPGRERLQIEAPVSLLGVLHATAQLWTALGRRLLYSPSAGPPPSDIYTPGRPALASSLAARREEQESEGADAAHGDDEILEPRASFGEEWMRQCRGFLLAPVIGVLADFVSRVELSEKCRLQQQERETRYVISYLALCWRLQCGEGSTRVVPRHCGQNW